MVRDALFHFNGQRYRLLAWCVMPNPSALFRDIEYKRRYSTRQITPPTKPTPCSNRRILATRILQPDRPGRTRIRNLHGYIGDNPRQALLQDGLGGYEGDDGTGAPRYEESGFLAPSVPTLVPPPSRRQLLDNVQSRPTSLSGRGGTIYRRMARNRTANATPGLCRKTPVLDSFRWDHGSESRRRSKRRVRVQAILGVKTNQDKGTTSWYAQTRGNSSRTNAKSTGGTDKVNLPLTICKVQRIKWAGLELDLSGKLRLFWKGAAREPVARHLYFDRVLNEEVYDLPGLSDQKLP